MRYLYLIALAVHAGFGCYGQVVVSQNENRVSSGYVFYAPTASESSHLLRNDGTIAHSWPGSGPAGVVVKLLADGSILRTGTIPTSIFFNGPGVGGRVEKRTWDGELLWSYTLPSPEKYIQHHDVSLLPNGNVVMIAWELHTAFEALAAGRDPATIPPEGIWSEAVFEVRPDPPSGGTIVWEWHVWDHLVQDANPSAGNFGSVRQNFGRIDINFTGINGNPASDPDWLHFNSISYNEELDQILLSTRVWSEIWVIDHSTTPEQAATSLGGKYAHGGDLLYRWGNPQAHRAGTAADQKLFAQHDAHWIDDDLPGAGHMLVFNNGVGRGYSSADELVPPMDAPGVYSAGTDGRFGPVAPVWSVGAPAGDPAGAHFYSLVAGGAQRLRNGNTILCLSSSNRVVEATPEGEIVWDLNLGAGAAGGFTFRANRFPADAPELAATDLGARAPVVRNAASLDSGVLAPGTLAVAQGAGFADPASVSVIDADGRSYPALVTGATPGVITFQLPGQTASGPARLTVSGADGTTQTRDFRVTGASPGLFAANGDGQGVGAVIAVVDGANGQTVQPAYQLDPDSKQFVPDDIPLDGSVYLSLFGTGWGEGNTPPRVTIGGLDVPVLYAGAIAEFPGVLQINVGPLPAALKGLPNQTIVVEQDGVVSNPVEVSFQ